jgi:hypothetical protein
MKQTFTSSHTLWTTTKTWLSTARSATCFTTCQKAQLEAIYRGSAGSLLSPINGFSSGSWISTADRNYLINIWTQMLTEYSG